MMITEGIIALIWAYATLTLFDGQTLTALIKAGTPSLVVSEIAKMTLGGFLGTLVILGVIILPITSGDTAFRAIRLMLAEYFHLPQATNANRLMIAVPSFIVSFVLCSVDFNILWQYFSWANQTLSAISLWICTIYLAKTGRNIYFTFIPALFMTTVVVTYILYAKIGFNIDLTYAKIAALIFTAYVGGVFFYKFKKHTI
jgi:carbon starvation protein CstA